jgi:predicted acyl esterase
MKRLFTLLAFSFFTSVLSAQIPPLTPIVDSIPMSDGRKLPADIYLPVGWTSGPVILIQTPYNRQLFRYWLPLGVGINIDQSNYAFVITDWRGFYGGWQANYAGAPSRGEDGYDIVEWIATQSWSNDSIGGWGPSALGKVQFQTAAEHPPHLTCICPLVAGPQFEYQEYFPNGVFRTERVEQLDSLGYGLGPLLLANPVYSVFWQYGVEAPNWYPDSIAVPALMIGGWYDHNIDLMFNFFTAIRAQSPAPVNTQHRLLMGPWCHGGNGAAYVGSAQQGELFYNNAAGWSDSLAMMYFDYHLRGINNGWNTTPVIQYYNLGADTWNNTASWPPTGMQNVTLYMHTDTTMDNVVPASSTGSISYLYDPTNPSPTVGGTTLRSDQEQGPFDQTDSVESRNDILTFTTAPLAQDMTVNGVITVHLEISSDKLDTDFAIRLCDVYPSGESMLVNDGIYRMRFRDGFTAADTNVMVPNNYYSVDIALANTSITFLQGHSMRIDVSSSNYPMYNRNMNTGQAMYPGPSQSAGDTLVNPQIANNTIYTNSAYPSRVTIPCNAWPNAITELSPVQTFSVYPNPSTNYVDVTSHSNEACTYTILDANGRVVKTQQSNSMATRISLEGLAAGVHVLQMKTENGVSSREIIVQ